MSSFSGRTTAIAYLEYAAARLQARGHATEIVTDSASGRMAIRVDGVLKSADEVSKMLAPEPSGPTTEALAY